MATVDEGSIRAECFLRLTATVFRGNQWAILQFWTTWYGSGSPGGRLSRRASPAALISSRVYLGLIQLDMVGPAGSIWSIPLRDIFHGVGTTEPPVLDSMRVAELGMAGDGQRILRPVQQTSPTPPHDLSFLSRVRSLAKFHQAVPSSTRGLQELKEQSANWKWSFTGGPIVCSLPESRVDLLRSA